MILYVTSLYKIRRETCRNERHYNGVGDRDHMTNYAGLKKIMGHERCEIKAFTKKDWKDLFGFANVSQAVSDQLLGRYGTLTLTMIEVERTRIHVYRVI